VFKKVAEMYPTVANLPLGGHRRKRQESQPPSASSAEQDADGRRLRRRFYDGAQARFAPHFVVDVATILQRPFSDRLQTAKTR
jgi:hypothetical protein